MEQKNTMPFSDLKLERFLLNELPVSEAERIREATVENLELQKYLNKLKLSNESILRKYPPTLLGIALEKKLRKERNNPGWFYKKAGVALSTVTLLIFVYIAMFFNDVSLHYHERSKGITDVISIYKKIPDGHQKLTDQATVSQGDIVQIGYTVSGICYGTIISIDGSGNVILHFPELSSESTLLAGKGEHFLRTSYELDNAPDFERFILVTSDKPLQVTMILSAAEKIAKTDSARSAELSLPGHINQYSCTLKKRASL